MQQGADVGTTQNSSTTVKKASKQRYNRQKADTSTKWTNHTFHIKDIWEVSDTIDSGEFITDKDYIIGWRMG